MDIKCFNDLKLYSDGFYPIESPSFQWGSNYTFYNYEVARDEDMRMDLVMKSIYGENFDYGDIDVILYINGIDNPINIREGMIILYPELENLDKYRYSIYSEDDIETTNSNKITKKLSIPNKTTRKDPNRQKYVNEYSLPPVVQEMSKSPVSIDSKNNKIIIGGL
jgi:hypothetical protein